MAASDPQPVHTFPVVRRSALHVPVRLTSLTDAPVPGPAATQPDNVQRRGNRRLVRRVKGSS